MACSCILTECQESHALRALWPFPAFSIGEDRGRQKLPFPAYPQISATPEPAPLAARICISTNRGDRKETHSCHAHHNPSPKPPLVSRCALKRYSRGGLMRVIRAPPPAYIRNFAGGWLLCSCRAKRPAAAQPGSALRGFRRPPNLTTPARIRHHVPRWRACS